MTQNELIDKDEVLKMARQAGIIAIHTEGDGHWHQQFIALEIFAKLVANKERTACANLCENMALYTGVDCADAIRARSCATSRGEA